MSSEPDPRRARAAMLAAAYGDALGWPVEDRGGRVGGITKVPARLDLVDWRRREGGPWASHEIAIHAGEYSDDTQLLLAAARSLNQGDGWLQHLREVELPVWTVYQRGGGGATKRSAQAWFQGRAPWQPTNAKAQRDYFSAGGNGTAMRCLPYAIRARDTSELFHLVDNDGVSTHAHPRALVGARAYAWAAFWAIRRHEPLGYGELIDRTLDAATIWGAPPALGDEWFAAAAAAGADFDRTWLQTTEEMVGLLSTARSGIGHGAVAVDGPVLDELGAFGKSKGAGTVTAAAAIFLAGRYATQPEQALLTSAFAKGGDTDTLASMTGGLLGALRGSDWLNKRIDRLQDRTYIAAQAEAVASGGFVGGFDATFRHADRRELYRWLDVAEVGSQYGFGPFGAVEVVEIVDLPSRSQFVRAWRLKSEIGQTVHISRADKGRPSGRPRWAKQPAPVPAPSATPGDAGPAAPRAGVVLPVFDLDEAATFYERVLGMPVRRRHEKWVSFGWLALEMDARRSQRRIVTNTDFEAGISIRLYMTRDRLTFVRRELERLGLPMVPIEPPSEGSFCSIDLDGHPLECLNVEKNSNPLVH